jgi:PAS domain S-box-containing protein
MSEDFGGRVIAFLDRFAPEDVAGHAEDRRRARLLVGMVIIGCSILVGSGVSTLLMGLDARLALYNFGWAALLGSLPLVLRHSGSLRFVANAIVGIAFLHLVLLSSLSGGQNIGALFAFSVFPLLAVLVAGWRSGLVFMGLAGLAILLTPLFPIQALAPTYLEVGPVPPAILRDALNVTIATGCIASLYDAVRSLTLRDAEDARARAEQSEARVRESSQRQAELLRLIQRFQDATPESFEEELGRAVQVAAKIAGANRSSLQLLYGDDLGARYSWSDDGIDKRVEAHHMEDVRGHFPWSAKLIAEGHPIHIASISDLPEEAGPERELMLERGMPSWLVLPVRIGTQAIGYQSFERTEKEKFWSESEISTLGLMTELLTAAVLRHRVEEALRESEAKFASAFRDHPDAMVISDLETDVVIECNDQWLREVGEETRESVLGRKLWDFNFEFPEEQREMIRELVRTQGRTPAVESRVRGRLGDVRTYLISATRIEVKGRLCVLANVHDLTDRKQLEQQLLHAQKMEAVGRLAGGIAHDFNNMLTVISGYSSSLVESLEGDERSDAEQIRDAARRSADLTRQLLAFSRRQILATEVLDPNDVVRGLEAMLRPLIGESIVLEIELHDAPGSVRADRGQLEQAIVNLAVNARDAMPSGGSLQLSTGRVEVAGDGDEVELPPDLQPGAYVVLRVVDDGEGMDPELVAHVVEPFYTTKPEGEGTGLGLSMVHGIARQSGGALVLESEIGRGTRAEVYLPAVAESPATRESSISGSIATVDGARRTILLVEDEPLLRRLTGRTLRHAGYEVVEAEDGLDALDRARELGDSIDMVVSDVVMPRLSGPDLCRRLREERPSLPVLLISGYPEPGRGGRPLPADTELLLKPFEGAELCAAVERALEDLPA